MHVAAAAGDGHDGVMAMMVVIVFMEFILCVQTKVLRESILDPLDAKLAQMADVKVVINHQSMTHPPPCVHSLMLIMLCFRGVTSLIHPRC